MLSIVLVRLLKQDMDEKAFLGIKSMFIKRKTKLLATSNRQHIAW